jgi:2-polyprenyl-3-methyl-5-hydroxy-6-metoxy-1,4-benzoquinol methylase
MSSAESTWSKAEIEDLLARENFKYQNISLPYGLQTGGEDRSATARAILPDDLSGASVLDIGCNFGFFCFEAAKRGASRVLGIDVDPENIRKARLLADCLGLDVEFALLDIEVDSLNERFDHVLCLNVLHHLRNPLASIEHLIEMTTGRLVLEVAGLGNHDRRKLGVPFLRYLSLRNSPVIYVGKNGTSGRPPNTGKRAGFSGQKFFFTQDAILHLLQYQRCVFARVCAIPSQHKGRFTVIAEKRRIEDLIVIAGPTSSGKSTLIDRLREGKEPDLARYLELDDPAAILAYNAFDLIEARPPQLERLLFHYDLLRPFLRSAHVHGRDEALDILGSGRRVRVLTIYIAPQKLRAQLEKAVITPKTRRGKFRGNKRKATIHEMYADSDWVHGWYQDFFSYCESRGVEVEVVLPEESMRCISVAEWQVRIAGERSESSGRTRSVEQLPRSYRDSHLDEGHEYHDKFLHSPYRSVIWKIEQGILEAILGRYRLRCRESLRMLDFACGTGRILQFFENQVDSAVGIDISETMLAEAKSHLHRTELLQADLTREPVLAGRQFELITAFRFFPNAEPSLREEVMQELVTLLAKDGILVMNNHLRCSGSKLRVRRALHRFAKRGKDRDLHCMSDAEVEALAERFGLSIVEIHPLGVLPVLKEKRPILPRSLISGIEHWVARNSLLANLANNRIYVLQHRAAGGTRDAGGR